MKALHLSLISLFLLTSCLDYNDMPTTGNLRQGQGEDQVNPTNLTVWGPNAFPLRVKFGEDLTNEEMNHFEDMINEWEIGQNQEYDFFETPATQSSKASSYTKLDDYYDDELGIYHSYSWFDELPFGILALTQYEGFPARRNNVDYIELTHSDIIVNDRDFFFATDENESQYDLISIVLHELGHFIGLDHISDPSTAMFAYINPGEIKRTPTAVDNEAIATLYNDIYSQGELEDNASRALSLKNNIVGKKVRGRRYLMANGLCVHELEGQVISSHSWKNEKSATQDN